MGDLSSRLDRIEERLPVGCATCRDWTVSVMRVQFGDEPPEPSRPATCPDCKREAPLTINLIRFTERSDGPA